MSDGKNFEVLTAEPVRLAHSPARRVRTWSREEKTRIVTETFAPGANVSTIARGACRWRCRGGSACRGDPGGAGGMIPAGVQVYVAATPVDFRKGANGLMALVREGGVDPFLCVGRDYVAEPP